MRRFLTGLTALAVLAYPLPLLANQAPEEGGDLVVDEEDELVLDESDMDAAPEVVDEGPTDTSFLDDDDGGGDTPAEIGATSFWSRRCMATIQPVSATAMQ